MQRTVYLSFLQHLLGETEPDIRNGVCLAQKLDIGRRVCVLETSTLWCKEERDKAPNLCHRR